MSSLKAEMSLLDVKVVGEDWLKSSFYLSWFFVFFVLENAVFFFSLRRSFFFFRETNKQIHSQVKTSEKQKTKNKKKPSASKAEYESPDLPFFNLNKTDFIQMVHVSVSTRLS